MNSNATLPEVERSCRCLFQCKYLSNLKIIISSYFFQDVDGVDVRNLNLNRLRSFISVVSQEPILFDCSIRENISYGLDSDVGMDDVIEAARKANIHDFITTLPMVLKICFHHVH